MELNLYTKRHSVSEENQMLHLTVYHQSSAVADKRQAPAGKLQFKNGRVALTPRLPTTLSSLHLTSAWCGFCTTQLALCFGLGLFFHFLSSQFSPVSWSLSTSSLTSLPRWHRQKPLHSGCCHTQRINGFHRGIFLSVSFGNRGSHAKTEFARLQRADNVVQGH